jgi:signal transduction histidine kinase
VTAKAATTASLEPVEGGSGSADRLPRRLLQVITDLNADLDHDRIFTTICRSCVELTGADAAAFLRIDGDRAYMTSAVGAQASAADGFEYSISAEALARVVNGGSRHLIPDCQVDASEELRRALGPLHTAVLTGVMAKGQLVGALVALYEQVGHHITPAETELFDFLAGCGGVAIANAISYATVARAEAHHAAVIDGIADGVAVLDHYGLVTAWNSAAAELTDITAANALDRPFPLPLGEPGRPLEHHLGEGHWVELTASPLEVGQVVALHDISRQKALDSAKTMFVAATSHELKTPLTVIKSFSEWLRANAETAEPDRRQMALDAIASSAEELRQIVEKILLTARTEAGAIDLDLQSTDPARLVRAVASQFVVAGENHQLVINLPPDLPPVLVDVHAVRTALGQLLENAFKYSPDGGKVEVTARMAGDGTAVEVSVTDEGIGLAPGEAGYLFMAFYQGETRARSGVRGGVGLGLSIVRRLVEAMGGKVGAEGRTGRGSRFWFTIPVHHDDLGLLDGDGLDIVEPAAYPLDRQTTSDRTPRSQT